MTSLKKVAATVFAALTLPLTAQAQSSATDLNAPARNVTIYVGNHATATQIRVETVNDCLIQTRSAVGVSREAVGTCSSENGKVVAVFECTNPLNKDKKVDASKPTQSGMCRFVSLNDLAAVGLIPQIASPTPQ